MIKKYFILLIVLLFQFGAYCQQKAQYTQYMINPFLLNPAVAGTEEYGDFKAGYRNQWAGFKGAPRTMYLSGHKDFGRRVSRVRSSYVGDGFHGIGGIISNDVVGASSTINVSAAYSYHLTLAKKVFASLGASVGWQQYSLDAGMLNPGQTETILSNTSSGMGDFSVGGWLYSKKFYAGISMSQVASSFNLVGGNNLVQYTMAHHYFAMAGVRLPMDRKFTFIPSICIKGVNPAPVSMDLNAKIRYKEIAWAALSYRTSDAIAILMGIVVDNTFDVSYSYDFITSDIGLYTSTRGSHEIVLGYRLGAKGKIYSPSDFW